MGIASPLVSGQKFAVKPNVNIGIGNAINVKSDIQGLSSNASYFDFGADFSYKFWQKGGSRLEANIGIGYSISNLKLSIPSLIYDYNATASADIDNNPYIRYFEITNLEQKYNLGYFNIPIYLTYGYQFSERIGLHADLGVKLGFKCNAKMNSVSGNAYSYGQFPEYDDLIIKDLVLDDFGNSNLANSEKMSLQTSVINASLFVGATFDVRVAKSVWFNLGIRYHPGISNIFKKTFTSGNYTQENSPVTYTVADGLQVFPLANYLSSSKLSPFSIYVGLTINL